MSPSTYGLSELNDSQDSCSYITPSSDQDSDDTTLGKLLTETHRGQDDYCDPEDASVSQSSLSVVFDRTGKPVGERDVIHWFWCHVNETRAVLTTNFLKTPKLRKKSIPIPEGMLRPSFVSPRRKEGPPNIWDTPGMSGNVFANPHASSSAPYPQELNPPWKKIIEEPLHMSAAEKSDRPERNQDLRCQSGPSAKDSVIFNGGDSSKNHGADQQRLQISDLHFDKFPTPATFACWKIRFKTEVCTCSQFPTETMQWIKEVELADSVDELRSSSSIRSVPMPDFEILDARIASALNKIMHNSHLQGESVWRNKRPRKRTVSFEVDRLPT